MAKRIHQFQGISKSQISENILANYAPVIQLGIQAPQGTKFKINESNNYIVMGQIGIYELDLTNLGVYIYSLKFDQSNENIIVDIIYEGGVY